MRTLSHVSTVPRSCTTNFRRVRARRGVIAGPTSSVARAGAPGYVPPTVVGARTIENPPRQTDLLRNA
jgi:hypothetical protein